MRLCSKQKVAALLPNLDIRQVSLIITPSSEEIFWRQLKTFLGSIYGNLWTEHSTIS